MLPVESHLAENSRVSSLTESETVFVKKSGGHLNAVFDQVEAGGARAGQGLACAGSLPEPLTPVGGCQRSPWSRSSKFSHKKLGDAILFLKKYVEKID